MKEPSRRVVITLEMSSPDLANTVFRALQPEAAASHAFGSQVQISVEENLLTLSFSSQSTTTIRALVNSCLRWVMMIKDVIATVD